MQKKIIARTAKLLSEPGKNNRRYKGVAISYEHVPKDLEERNHGSIFAVINVNAETDEAKEIAELIIETLHGEFYLKVNDTPLASFESALAKINEELAEATHQGKIGWMNNLNAVLAVLEGNTIHMTKVGKTEAYLYRGEKTSHVSHDLAGDSINPLRTFINIASGELAEGDKISIATPGVFFHISKDELKKYVKEFQPKVAISHIADLLEGTAQNMQPNAVLIIEGISPEAASSETLNDQPDEVWVTPPTHMMENAVDSAMPVLMRVAKIVTAGWAIFTAFLTDKFIPFAKDIPGHTKNMYMSLKGLKKEKNKISVLTHTNESLSTFKNDDLNINTIIEDEVLATPSQKSKKPNEIYIKETRKPSRIKLERFDFSFAEGLINSIKNTFSRYANNRKRILFMGIGLIFVLSISVFAVWSNRENGEKLKLAKASLTEAQSKYDIAKNALDSGDRKLATEDLIAAKQIADNLTTNKDIKANATSLLADITKLLDQAENNIHPGSSQIANVTEIIGTDALGPYQVGTNLFIISKNNGSIAAISTTNNEVSNVLDKPSTSGKFIAAAPITARNVLILVTDNGTFYEFDTKENTLNKQTMSGDIEKVRGIAAFSTNIYTLSEDGKIYKRLKSTGGYAKRSEYITDGSTVSNGVNLAIDSSVYALTNTDVAEYLAGKKQRYTITNMPFALENPKMIYANENVKGQFIVDGKNRIIRLDENGKYISEFTESNFDLVSGLAVDSNNVYFAAKGKVYKFSL